MIFKFGLGGFEYEFSALSISVLVFIGALKYPVHMIVHMIMHIF